MKNPIKEKTDSTTDEKVIKISDRCDRCGARARVKAEMMNGELFFCGHHFQENEVSIHIAALRVIDEREKSE